MFKTLRAVLHAGRHRHRQHRPCRLLMTTLEPSAALRQTRCQDDCGEVERREQLGENNYWNAKRSMHMTEDELNRIVESKLADRLAARLQADREAVRTEVIRELRREADRAWYDRVNRKHPIEDRYSGLGAEGHAARLREMDRRAKADFAAMDEANRRWNERTAADAKARRDEINRRVDERNAAANRRWDEREASTSGFPPGVDPRPSGFTVNGRPVK
jgi:hypothetical protein